MNPLIELNDVLYRYPLTRKSALRHIQFKVTSGMVMGIIGVNGSGKTTLCNVIRSFIPNFYQGDLQGTVTLKGKPLNQYSETELSQLVGYIFQNPFTQISGVKDTVAEEIGYGLENLGVSSKKIQKRVAKMIDLLNLSDIKDKNPFDLSGGQKQMVAIAAILAINPEIFIFDEPTSQLDPAGTTKIFKIIQQLKSQGKTVILVEHKLDLMMQYIDQLLVLDEQGQQIAWGKPEEILASFTENQTIALPTATRVYQRMAAQHLIPIATNKVPVTQDEIVQTIQNFQETR
ncbi:energy-coupling factor ABC transporter ATP-binding protein [Levilactobacillus acidifarinae]|uniref:ABC transporter, ATP-binding protein n=1 Tax=Levilactobacillus acidifarinae DSM 19394 = JCM 15949 TaxID=1423715 RepID=A0A0R1LUY2_9LACO|nr:ABC transporter ATP-binding protein [Levilactobacillus acidifarinae]KRK95351.1 ABC transporter, ATP-binding protein [Levilactobacillus acidifarinae DSM 19394]GEO70057.1 ABC transporter ATP-binding protein [Levilactobacillus acidifarinae]